MLNQEDLIKKVKTYNRFFNPETLSKAYSFALNAHKNQKRDAGEPLIIHPVAVASILVFIEEKLQRKRKHKNDPRTCDIDIIDYNGQIIDFKYKELNFMVPHTKLTLRNFVLFPLQEILPKWRHPKTKESISTLIQKLPDEDVKSILKIKKN